MDQSLAQRVRSTCALNVCMQMGARAVRLQCTSWTSMTAKSTHAHYVRMRIMKCIAQTFAIENCANHKVQKILQIQKVAFDLRYETSGRLLPMPSTTSHSSYHISTDLWLAWHFSRTQFDITNQKAIAHIFSSSLVMDNALLISDVKLRS